MWTQYCYEAITWKLYCQTKYECVPEIVCFKAFLYWLYTKYKILNKQLESLILLILMPHSTTCCKHVQKGHILTQLINYMQIDKFYQFVITHILHTNSVHINQIDQFDQFLITHILHTNPVHINQIDKFDKLHVHVLISHMSSQEVLDQKESNNCTTQLRQDRAYKNVQMQYLADHLPTTYQPSTDHLPTIYPPPTNHLLTTYQPSTNHLPTTYQPPTKHFFTVQLVHDYQNNMVQQVA